MADAHDHNAEALDTAVAGGGAFEVVRRRLLEQMAQLEAACTELNQRREAAYGKASQAVIQRVRVRTEHNCVPCDIVRISSQLLFGYNVFIGLKKDTTVEDVFATYDLLETDDGLTITPAAQAPCLTDPRFVADFQELYAYYKHTQLRRMQVVQQKLLITFQIGEAITDLRVFRWRIEPDQTLVYLDDRGERDVPKPPTHDFEWVRCRREQMVMGQHPHYSILDQVFVETIGGDLTVKVENNTDAGYGIFSEPVDEPNQSLDDADVEYAHVGGLILLKIRPYRETVDRYLVFNPASERISRIDAIGIACHSLPEDHGIVFPGGVYLQNDALTHFEGDVAGLVFSRKIRSPNGEDVLYVFYEPTEGRYGLLAYNLIRKTLQNPIYAHGYSLFEDGKLVVFRSDSPEPTRNHPMQIWQTAFYDDDHVPPSNDVPQALAKIGNTDLVRGISDIYGVVQLARSPDPHRHTFNALIEESRRAQENHYWLDEPSFDALRTALSAVAQTSDAILDEYEKVEAIQAHARETLQAAEHEQRHLLQALKTDRPADVQGYVQALGDLRKQRGHLLTVRELRYIDTKRVDALESAITEAFDQLAQRTVSFLLDDDALTPYAEDIRAQRNALAEVTTTAEVEAINVQLTATSDALDTLTEVLGTLQVRDATERTRILEAISQLYATLNQAKAQARIRTQELGEREAVAEFAAQFTLLSQSIASALGQVETPDACDAQMSRLAISLEELEARFGEHDAFLADIVDKREELFDAFATRKQALVDAQAQRAANLYGIGERILDGLGRRAEQQADADALNAFFSTDPMVQKLKELVQSLSTLGDSVKADDLDARWRAARDNAFRAQRDHQELFDGDVIKLGEHRFNVNSQAFELTLVPRGRAPACTAQWHRLRRTHR